MKRLYFEWNINCPFDGEKNDYEEEHEVYDAIYEIDDKHNLIVQICEYDEGLCNHQSNKVVLKTEMSKHTEHIRGEEILTEEELNPTGISFTIKQY